MRTKFRSIVAGIALLSVSACTAVSPARDMPEIVSSVGTASEHVEIADYFAQKAQNYETEARMHQQMRQSYVSSSKGQGNLMAAHCDSLQRNFIDSARLARSLEKAHRELAAGTR